MRFIPIATGLVAALWSTSVQAEVQDCIEIVALPAVITQQGVHCFKKDLNTPNPTATAITVNAPNVIIEMNGFKLGGLGAGASTLAVGIYAYQRQNITIRNGTIRGFYQNVALVANADPTASSGHLVENLRIESARHMGIVIAGTRSTVRNNILFDIGNGAATVAYGIVVQEGEGHSVTGNSITGVMETQNAYGIYSAATTAPYIRGNQVRNISGSPSRGIYVNAARAVVQDNFVSNAVTGSSGIMADGTPDACIENVVTNFAAALSGCSEEQGNIEF